MHIKMRSHTLQSNFLNAETYILLSVILHATYWWSLEYFYMLHFWLMVTILSSTLSVVADGFPLPSKVLFFLILFSALWQDPLSDVYVFWESQSYIDLLCSVHLKLQVALDMHRYPENKFITSKENYLKLLEI